MILDSLLRLSKEQSATGASENTIDFGVKAPNSGMAGRQLYLIVVGKSGFASGDTLDVAIQHSDEESSSFANIAQSGAQAIGVGKQIVMPMPLVHKRYIKLNYTKTGTGGKVDAYIVDGLQMAIVHEKNPKVWP